jgi:hypothetical protein
MEQALLDTLHKRWAEKHEQWLRGQERKRARLNGSTNVANESRKGSRADMGCGRKKGRGRGGGKGR